MGPPVARREEMWDTTHVVDVNVCQDHGLEVIHREIDPEIPMRAPTR
jgi:hypothetical protein